MVRTETEQFFYTLFTSVCLYFSSPLLPESNTGLQSAESFDDKPEGKRNVEGSNGKRWSKEDDDHLQEQIKSSVACAEKALMVVFVCGAILALVYGGRESLPLPKGYGEIIIDGLYVILAFLKRLGFHVYEFVVNTMVNLP